MIYVTSTITGMILLIACVALFIFALAEMNLDARSVMGHYPFISLPTMAAIFAAGFLVKFRRARRTGKTS